MVLASPGRRRARYDAASGHRGPSRQAGWPRSRSAVVGGADIRQLAPGAPLHERPSIALLVAPGRQSLPGRLVAAPVRCAVSPVDGHLCLADARRTRDRRAHHRRCGVVDQQTVNSPGGSTRLTNPATSGGNCAGAGRLVPAAHPRPQPAVGRSLTEAVLLPIRQRLRERAHSALSRHYNLASVDIPDAARTDPGPSRPARPVPTLPGPMPPKFTLQVHRLRSSGHD